MYVTTIQKEYYPNRIHLFKVRLEGSFEDQLKFSVEVWEENATTGSSRLLETVYLKMYEEVIKFANKYYQYHVTN